MKDAGKVTNWLAKRGKCDILAHDEKMLQAARIMMDHLGDGNGPRTCHNGRAWTVTYGQIIFTLTPFFAQDVSCTLFKWLPGISDLKLDIGHLDQ